MKKLLFTISILLVMVSANCFADIYENKSIRQTVTVISSTLISSEAEANAIGHNGAWKNWYKTKVSMIACDGEMKDINVATDFKAPVDSKVLLIVHICFEKAEDGSLSLMVNNVRIINKTSEFNR